ncbi:winged helix-turn-helix transcriptional regulator [Streptomyces abikoensis]
MPRLDERLRQRGTHRPQSDHGHRRAVVCRHAQLQSEHGRFRPFGRCRSLHTDGPLRFKELRRAVVGISERVLISQLKEMEASQLVHREEFHQVPPKVEYSLTEFGASLLGALMPLGEWGSANMERITSLVASEPANGPVQARASVRTGM